MPIKRGPDGVPVDMPSTKIDRDSNTGDMKDRGTIGDFGFKSNDQSSHNQSSVTFEESSGGAKSAADSLFLDEKPTERVSEVATGSRKDLSDKLQEDVRKPAESDDGKTRIVRGVGNNTGNVASSDSAGQQDAMADPVAGWLVVIDGPGQGEFLKVGYGQNSIGRNTDERISLPFGDSQVSRQSHAVLTYDSRGKQFYLQPGTGTNLTYLNDEPTPVLQPVILKPFSHIVLGGTTLRFVPFCDESFNWEILDGE